MASTLINNQEDNNEAAIKVTTKEQLIAIIDAVLNHLDTSSLTHMSHIF